MTNVYIDATSLRDLLHNLNTENESHISIYNRARYIFISQNEGVFKVAYDDVTGKPVTDLNNIKGKVTIGIGFNMDAVGARDVWDKTFKGALDFDCAKSGHTKLMEGQLSALFKATIESRSKDLQGIYGNIFQKLRLNERLVIEDAYFNYPGLVDKNSSFFKYINDYYATSKASYLRLAINEIKNRSNPKKVAGIQNRRDRQAELLSSTSSPFYSSPSDERLPKKSNTFVIPGKTVIPRGTERWEKGGDPKYYIWRTNWDEKVGEAYLLQEGKIFSNDNPSPLGDPKEVRDCKCWAEDLPKDFIIADSECIIMYEGAAEYGKI